MARITFEQVEEELDLEFFLERESVSFKVTRGVNGVQLNIRTCPFCHDARWRTYFGVDTGRGNCFVCSRGFNKASFIHAYYDHQNWRDTWVEIEAILRDQGWRPKRKAVVAVDHGDIQLPVSDPLPLEDGSNLAYLEQRGFSGEIAEYFKLRWCQFGWWRYRDEEGNWQNQNFADRIIIPVYDLDGTLKTFQGRDITGTSKSKYLFPKELPGTGRYLFNGQNVIATDHVVMGEGAFDVAAIKVAFDEDAQLRHVVPIGSFGKHLSYGSTQGDDQLGRFVQLKARGVKFVTLMWDGEEKALVAALDAAKLLAGIGLTARVALLPYEKDPNEVTPDVVRAAFYKAEPWSSALDLKWRMRNPYSERERARLGL